MKVILKVMSLILLSTATLSDADVGVISVNDVSSPLKNKIFGSLYREQPVGYLLKFHIKQV